MKFCSTIALAIAVLVSFSGLAAASGHATSGTTTTTTAKTTNPAENTSPTEGYNASTNTPAAGVGNVAATLEANERQINECFKTQDTKTFMSLVEANGWMANANGFSPVSAVPEMMKQINLTSYSIEGFKAQKINPETYLVTYTYTRNGTYKGQTYPAGPWYCSSVWSRHGTDWKAAFHQESLGVMASNGNMMPPSSASVNH